MRTLFITILILLASCTSTSNVMPQKEAPTGIPLWSSKEGQAGLVMHRAPMYPEKLRVAGIEGWVLVEFSVSEHGVIQSITIINSSPKDVFDEEAIISFQISKYFLGAAKTINEQENPRVQRLVLFERE